MGKRPRSSLAQRTYGVAEDISTLVSSSVLCEGPAIPPPLEIEAINNTRGPLVLPYRRGSGDKALALLLAPGGIDRASALTAERAYAKSSAKPRADKLALWNNLASKAGFHPPECSPECMAVVNGALVGGDFRSASSYLSLAKQQHVRIAMLPWTETHQLQFADCCRAATRGQGTAQQSAPFPLLEMMNIPTSSMPACADGPTHPHLVCTIATWFALREVEAACIQMKDLRFNKQHKSIKITLSASKCDPTARSTSRTLSCLCVSLTLPPHCCPFCATLELARLQSIGKSSLPEFQASYLITDSLGGQVTKTGMINSLRVVAAKSGYAYCNGAGRSRLTGHAFRVGGAHVYAALGLPIVEIQYVMRHSSSCVLRYLEGTTLQSLKTAVARALNPGYSFSLDLDSRSTRTAFVQIGKITHSAHESNSSATACALAWPVIGGAVAHVGPTTCKHCLQKRALEPPSDDSGTEDNDGSLSL
jgi:hypothetical protein